MGSKGYCNQLQSLFLKSKLEIHFFLKLYLIEYKVIKNLITALKPLYSKYFNFFSLPMQPFFQP